MLLLLASLASADQPSISAEGEPVVGDAKSWFVLGAETGYALWSPSYAAGGTLRGPEHRVGAKGAFVEGPVVLATSLGLVSGRFNAGSEWNSSEFGQAMIRRDGGFWSWEVGSFVRTQGYQLHLTAGFELSGGFAGGQLPFQAGEETELVDLRSWRAVGGMGALDLMLPDTRVAFGVRIRLTPMVVGSAPVESRNGAFLADGGPMVSGGTVGISYSL